MRFDTSFLPTIDWGDIQHIFRSVRMFTMLSYLIQLEYALCMDNCLAKSTEMWVVNFELNALRFVLAEET